MEIIEKSYKAQVEELQDLLSFLEDFLMLHHVSIKDTMVVNVAVEEIFVNIASYAYRGVENKGTKITFIYDNGVLTIEFVDWGVPFDPLAKEDPDVKAKIEDRGIGGLGIYMVKKSMDECSYERKDNQNVFVIRKKLKINEQN